MFRSGLNRKIFSATHNISLNVLLFTSRYNTVLHPIRPCLGGLKPSLCRNTLTDQTTVSFTLSANWKASSVEYFAFPHLNVLPFTPHSTCSVRHCMCHFEAQIYKKQGHRSTFAYQTAVLLRPRPQDWSHYHTYRPARVEPT